MNKEFRSWDGKKFSFSSDCSGEGIPAWALSEFFEWATHDPIQQYIGLTDSRGQKIFEGDIVYLNHYDVPEVDKQCLFEIIFEDGAFQLNPIKLGQAPNGGVSGFTWMRYIEGEDSNGNTIYRYELPPPEPICGFRRMVVIGNIFENPELLK